ncbi:MAG: FHIPEP family type III secretion protein [Vulcanimicrobiota bacterium]
MPKQKAFHPSALGEAEIVLTDAKKNAVALSYKPGQTPTVVALASTSARFEEMLWCAQELALPIVESAKFGPDIMKELRQDQIIPESLYRMVALALAAAQKSHQAPTPIRLVRALGKKPSSLAKRLGVKASELIATLELAQIEMVVGPGFPSEGLDELVELSRQRLELEFGLMLSPIPVRLEPALEGLAYRVRIRGVDAISSELEPGDGVARLARPLLEAVEAQAWRLLGYREVEALVKVVKKSHSALYKELFPHRLSLGALRQILRNLLRERVSIRDLPGILEAILDHLEATEDADLLTEYVRSAFRYHLSNRFSDRVGRLHALMLDPAAERAILRGLRESSSAVWLDLDLDESLKILGSVARGLEKAAAESLPVVILCSPKPRRFLRRLLEPSFPFLPVLSYSEVAPLTEVNTVCMVGR